MSHDSLTLLNLIAQTIFDKKGINILALDIRKISTICDYVIIAEGNVDKHVTAIAKAIIEEMQKIGEKTVSIEGLKEGDWIVIDYYQIIVHLFMPGLRGKYQLEELWRKGEIVDLNIVLNEKPLERLN